MPGSAVSVTVLVEERVARVDLDERLWALAAHGGAETTVELEDDELVEQVGAQFSGTALKSRVVEHHALRRRGDLGPVDALAAAEISRLEGLLESVHLLLEEGALFLILSSRSDLIELPAEHVLCTH